MSTYQGIPPPDIRVRIMSLGSRQVLYNNPRNDNEFGHFNCSEIWDDQYWYIQPGQGYHRDHHLIVSACTGRALYVNWRDGTHGVYGDVGTSKDVGAYDDQHFDLLETQGTSARKNQYRIHSPTGKANFFSRTAQSPQLGCLSDDEKIYPDHWFTFEMEPLTFDRIVFDLKHPDVVTTRIQEFTPLTMTNGTDSEQSQEKTLSEETEQQTTFTSEVGVSASWQSTISSGVPCLLNGSVSMTATVSGRYAWGKTTITRQKWEIKVPLRCPPKSEVKAVTTVVETRMRMAFVSYWKTKSGNEVRFNGTYEGQNCAGLHTEFSETKHEGPKKDEKPKGLF